MMKIKPFFKKEDFWIGLYHDKEKRVLYFCPFPMIGIKIERSDSRNGFIYKGLHKPVKCYNCKHWDFHCELDGNARRECKKNNYEFFEEDKTLYPRDIEWLKNREMEANDDYN